MRSGLKAKKYAKTTSVDLQVKCWHKKKALMYFHQVCVVRCLVTANVDRVMMECDDRSCYRVWCPSADIEIA